MTTTPKAKRRNNRHPLLREWPQGEFYQAAVGVVSGYPKSRAIYEAQKVRLKANRERAVAAGTLTRHGIPNGWAGRKDEVAEIRRNSRTDAERLCEKVFQADCYEARIAMQACMEIALCELNPMRVRLSAMHTILTYTVPRPATDPTPKGPGSDFLVKLAALARNGLD
jgi:hypothetical protein